jgi:hypothetical protein
MVTPQFLFKNVMPIIFEVGDDITIREREMEKTT